MWFEKVSLSSMITPRSEHEQTWGRFVLPREWIRGLGDFELEIDSTEHLGREMGSCHRLDQWRRVSRAFWRSGEDTWLGKNSERIGISSEKSLRSSAKNVGWASRGMRSQRSLIKTSNNRGPSTDPYKMPLSTDLKEEKIFWILTDWDRPVNQAAIQLCSSPRIL